MAKTLFSLLVVSLLSAGQRDCVGQEVEAVDASCGVVTCTVMVPERVMETRTRCVTKYRQEERTRTYNVMRCIPETQQIEEMYTVLVPQQRTRTVSYTVRRPVTEQVQVKYMVRIPQREARPGYRTVRRVVRETQMRTVAVRGGHWETRTYTVPTCDPCGCPTVRTCCRRVWVPTCETRQVPCTVCRVVCERVPCTYYVTTYRCEERMRTVCRTRFECEQRTREVCYTVCVPEQRTRTRCVTTYRRECEPHTTTYTVCVPYVEQQEYQVSVCRMVPKQIQVPRAPCCDPCCCQDTCCGCGGCCQ